MKPAAIVHNYEFETTVNADIELLKNRLFAGFNLLYKPEVTLTAAGETLREANFGGSAALSLRIASNVVIGGEVWYLRHLRCPQFDFFRWRCGDAGTDALYPVHAENVMTAAWNTQVWGREIGNPVSLNPIDAE